MPNFVWKGIAAAPAQLQRASSSPPIRRTPRSPSCAGSSIEVTDDPGEGARRSRSRSSAAAVAAAARRHLHPPVLGHDRRRPAARAVPRDPGRRSRRTRAFQTILIQIRQDVESGSTLADAMRKHPKVFNDLYTNMVAAGEAGGILDTILQRLANYIEKSVKLNSQVKSAMIYPGRRHLSSPPSSSPSSSGRSSRSSPQLFNGLGGELPMPTRIVIGSRTSSPLLPAHHHHRASSPVVALSPLPRDLPRQARPRRHHSEDARSSAC